jgi:hypothetical protein
VFEPFVALFPHHSKNSVIQEEWFDGYHIKCLLQAQIVLKQGVKNGEFDAMYSEHERKMKLEYLKNTELVMERSNNHTNKIPTSINEISKYTSRDMVSKFASKKGAHNMRHAGVTEMASRMPLHLVRIIVGHADINTTMRVYLHPSEYIVGKEIREHGQRMRLNEPASSGYGFIEDHVLPIIESSDPDEIKELLIENGFFSIPRELRKPGSSIKEIVDGIEYASGIHPASWTIYNHGFCPKNSCPPETRGKCSLCPYLLVSIMHIEGVIFKLNKCFLDSSLVASKLAHDVNTGTNTTRDELTAAYNNLVEEIIGWTRLLRELENRVCQSEDLTNALVANSAQKATQVFSYRKTSVEESMVDQLLHATDLKVDDVEHDNYIHRLTHNITRVAIRNYKHDPSVLEKIEQSGIRWLLQECAKLDLLDKKEYLKKHMTLSGESGANNAFELLKKPKQLLSS